MMTEGFQEDQLLHHFLLQEKLLACEGKTMMKKKVRMRKNGFLLLLDLVVRQRGTLLLVECEGSLTEVYAGR